MTQTYSSNNEFLICKMDEILKGYTADFKKMQEDSAPQEEIPEYISSMGEVFEFIINTCKELQKHDIINKYDQEFIDRVYQPNTKAIVEYSYIYEFESLVSNELLDHVEHLTPEQIEDFDRSLTYLDDNLNIYFNHFYGYTLDEIEDEMIAKSYGVFAPLSNEELEQMVAELPSVDQVADVKPEIEITPAPEISPVE